MMTLRIGIAVLAALFAAGTALGREADFAYIIPEQFLNSDASEADRLEGIWQASGDGAIFAIRRLPATVATYELLMIDSPDWQIAPGTPFGTLRSTGSPNTFDASLLSDPSDSRSRKRDFIFELSPDRGCITFRPYRRNHSINFERWFRYLFRATIKEPTRPKDIDGAIRLGSDKLITL